MRIRKIVSIYLIISTLLFMTGCSVSNGQNTATINESEDKVTNSSSSSELKVHFIDVGQADCIFIDYGDYDILIDAGNNADGPAVVNYLKSLNTDDIEIMVATHSHEDHIGGLDDVLKAFKVEKIIDSGYASKSKTYKDYYYAATHEKDAEFIYDDDLVYDLGDNIKFEVIEAGDDFGNNTNEYSVLTKLTYNDTSFLFTGDMEKEAERNVLNRDIKTDVLKMAHHGSRTSSTLNFLKKVDPAYAVIMVGKDNDYGHPNSETLTKLNKLGAKVFRTDKQGTVVATTDGKNIEFNVKATATEMIPNTQEASNDIIDHSSDDKLISEVSISSIDLKDEIVIVQNTSNADVNMTGWYLRSVKGNQTFKFPEEFILKAGDKVSIVSGKSNGDLKWGRKNVWSNSGDPGELYDANGKLVSNY